MPDVVPAVAVCNFEDLLRTGFWAHIQMLFVGTVSGPSLKVFCGHGVRIQVQRLFAEAVSRGKCKDLSRIRFRANIFVDTVPGPRHLLWTRFLPTSLRFPAMGLAAVQMQMLVVDTVSGPIVNS